MYRLYDGDLLLALLYPGKGRTLFVLLVFVCFCALEDWLGQGEVN